MAKRTGRTFEQVAAEVIAHARSVRRFDSGRLFIGTADCAKLMRAALCEAFAGVTFSVRSRSYSGGASVDISWTDGPTERQVDAVVRHFSGASFDGMIDLKSYHDSELLGQRVHYSCDWPSTSREYTADFLRRRCAAIAAKYGVPAPAVKVHEDSGHAWIDRDGEPLWDNGSAWRGDTAGDLAWHLAVKTAAVLMAR